MGANVELQRQVAFQPESILSSYEAIARIGFDDTLGLNNVFVGTEFHKKLLKDTFCHDFNVFCRMATQQMSQALDKELLLLDLFSPSNTADPYSGCTSYSSAPDLFQLARIVILRTILAVFCGTCFLEDHHVFLLKDLMELQDKIEHATAAAAVLPHRVANWLVLGPTRKFRLKVQEKIVRIIMHARQKVQEGSNDNDDSNSGSNAKNGSVPYYGPWLLRMDEQDMDIQVMAELIVGLVFAAHKNPAIGAAQSFCHVWEQKEKEMSDTPKETASESGIWNQVLKEARTLETVQQESSSLFLTWDQLQNLAPAAQACVKETTRITAHSLGSLRLACKEVLLNDGQGRQYTIYPGETISSSHYLYNVDPTLFPKQVDQFRPDVLLTSSSSSTSTNMASSPSKKGEKYNVERTLTRPLTFSQGTHKCPGEQVAMILMQYFVVLLLQRDASVLGIMPLIDFERATLAQRRRPVPVRLLRHKNKFNKELKVKTI